MVGRRAVRNQRVDERAGRDPGPRGAQSQFDRRRRSHLDETMCRRPLFPGSDANPASHSVDAGVAANDEAGVVDRLRACAAYEVSHRAPVDGDVKLELRPRSELEPRAPRECPQRVRAGQAEQVGTRRQARQVPDERTLRRPAPLRPAIVPPLDEGIDEIRRSKLERRGDLLIGGELRQTPAQQDAVGFEIAFQPIVVAPDLVGAGLQRPCTVRPSRDRLELKERRAKHEEVRVDNAFARGHPLDGLLHRSPSRSSRAGGTAACGAWSDLGPPPIVEARLFASEIKRTSTRRARGRRHLSPRAHNRRAGTVES